ncbi:aminotransferase [Asticcacaulis sp. AC402]|uniref:aminotransferase n=1 Tax=Asticcacaulis sp. AC402 TaxID=1282361 RepID=UPI0003C3C060|nr:aminotransferase [Asticcacaulis sp. AC402]ESQ74277.1 hypothetical protein ABAC402_15025 [Asticcacaulis sp. AC402]
MTPHSRLDVLHPASSIAAMLQSGPRRMASAKGVRIRDDTGHELLDGTAGLWCVNIGHGREEIAQVMADAVRNLDYFHTFGGYSNAAQETLGARLVAMAPGDLNHVFFGSSGSDANDTILKIIWHYNNLLGRRDKKKIVSRWGAYHGTSISTASLTGLKSFHDQFDLPIERILHTECPHAYRFATEGEDELAFSTRLIDAFKQLIHDQGAETIAAFIGEPVLGAGGVVPPPKGYWAGIQQVCQENDILLVADEVVCGFGRTGADFGSQTYDIRPDFMATAKGLTSGVFPMSAAFMTTRIWDVLHDGSKALGGFSHGYTYSGHPVGAAVANAVLDIYQGEHLADNARRVGAHLMQRLSDELGDHPHVGEIRGVGLVCAVQLVEDKSSRRLFEPGRKLPAAIAEAAYGCGLIVRPLPSIGALAFSPPLTLTLSDADEMVTRFVSAFTRIMSTV